MTQFIFCHFCRKTMAIKDNGGRSAVFSIRRVGDGHVSSLEGIVRAVPENNCPLCLSDWVQPIPVAKAVKLEKQRI